jgi:hypothetical protein
MELQLLTQNAAAKLIAKMAHAGQSLEIRLGEDICFGEAPSGWIKTGTIKLFPLSTDYVEAAEADEEVRYDEVRAVEFGGFEWVIPTEEELLDNLDEVIKNTDLYGQRDDIWKFFCQGIQDVLRRTHLLFPVFDVHTITSLPLEKPTTIVADTSAVHQGGLDFVAHFLVPWSRIKVPATVHMELVQSSDNYFSLRRKGNCNAKQKLQALNRHLLSQGGQRTLIRLEYKTEIEIERGDLGTDPLRSILTTSKDPQDKDLGLLTVVKSFGDRLIIETAHQIRTKGRSNHPVVILTSDQGMARMAIAEGLKVFFFQARSAPTFLGKRITGSLFHPFKPEMYTVSLTSVLWEIAVSFGCLQLQNPVTGASLELFGIGGKEWQPLHAKDDLLWGRFSDIHRNTDVVEVSDSETDVSTTSDIIQNNELDFEKSLSETSQELSSGSKHRKRILLTGYKFSPNKMFQFIGIINEKKMLDDPEGQKITGLTHPDSYRRYKSFLESGNFVDIHGESITAREVLREFWQALADKNLQTLRLCLLQVPSFKILYDFLRDNRFMKFSQKDFRGWPMSATALPSYLSVGEAVCAWQGIYQKGVTITDQYEMSLPNFAEIAVEAYQKLSTEDETEWVLTGKWLEALALEHAIHPMVTKALLEKAKDENLLQVYAEGSTPDTRFENHTLQLLSSVDGSPKLARMHLYHGDFLIPGTSSVRVKLQGVHHHAS